MVALDIRTPPTLRVDTFDHRKSQGYNSLTTDVVVEPKVEIREVDLKNQVENLKLLIASVEADIGRKEENKLTAQTTEAWLLTLRERIEEVEEDTGEALEKRRKLVSS